MQKEKQVSFLAEKIRQADAVLIGGGSGLSSAAGYNHYHWLPYMEEYLQDFKEWYGLKSPFDGFLLLLFIAGTTVGILCTLHTKYVGCTYRTAIL